MFEFRLIVIVIRDLTIYQLMWRQGSSLPWYAVWNESTTQLFGLLYDSVR